MTAMPETTRRRSWLRPRFSLRVLLLAFTAFAIGFPIWYRWPYEERQVIDPFCSRFTTWQRQWGGGRLQHGIEREVCEGEVARLTTYRNGTKHGPYSYKKQVSELDGQRSWVLFWKQLENGQYCDGQKDGVWTEVIDGQQQTITYDHGKQVAP